MTTENAGSGQVVVVTGASSGIGREVALRYARRHDHLVLASRSEEMLREVAEECFDVGAADVLIQSTDIAECDDVEKLFDVAVTTFGRVDVTVQSAAITAFGRFEDVPADVFEAIVRTNLLGSANVARGALKHYQQRGAGHLVLVGSLLGAVAVPYQSAYVASKFALCGLVRALRQENRNLPGVRVHGVYPGPVDTPAYNAAENFLRQTPRVPPTADTAVTIAKAIVQVSDRRKSTERQIGWLNLPAIAAYRLLPRAFDAVIGRLVRSTAFTTESTEPAGAR
ncbi:SDR family NAD(P)-dependent oxidoreductase [Mycolicibacterium sp. BiH015]|uniref:SDR family NAD(P)-dependent oxidoreductase n=1 Tax=Mycolicibacterium sp. BiH015 TaxID=3018808 RepID=UPI0022E63BF4|nr:SDR family NAD(P)-dependent oxidoreductase [Mycolicibacterium sp. BiH015]MDA2892608.1 SDR family NAD(P)-dependent oxidoreductase [Mycolicibacterium sp. BiH015]